MSPAVTMAGMASVSPAAQKLDARALRRDFPIFEQEMHGKPLAFLDSAASSQKPRQMLAAMDRFYETSYANVHRGVYELAERATEALERSRERMRAFLNAPQAREVIFVRNATEGLNLVAYAWGLWNLGPGDLVVVTELEHHSNFVPWQFVAGKRGAELRLLPLDEHGELDLSGLDRLPREGAVKVVAANLVCDAAQAAPHMKLDVQALDVDFLALSGHKMCGPSGIGVLWGRAELLQAMEP